MTRNSPEPPEKKKPKRAARTVKIQNPVVGVIIGQAGFPRALRDVALSIVPDETGLEVVSNGDQPTPELDEEIKRIADRHPNNPILVFADMCGTSCCHAATRLRRSRADVQVVNGVNLPMLVRFLQYRTKKNIDWLVRQMCRAARQGT